MSGDGGTVLPETQTPGRAYDYNVFVAQQQKCETLGLTLDAAWRNAPNLHAFVESDGIFLPKRSVLELTTSFLYSVLSAHLQRVLMFTTQTVRGTNVVSQ